MPGKFVVKKGSTGKFRFNLVSTNGQVIATSEVYNSKAACMNGVKAVQKLATTAALEDQTTKEWAAAEAERKKVEAAKKAKKAAAKKAAAKKAKAAAAAAAATEASAPAEAGS